MRLLSHSDEKIHVQHMDRAQLMAGVPHSVITVVVGNSQTLSRGDQVRKRGLGFPAPLLHGASSSQLWG